MRDPQFAGLRAIRAVLTAVALAILIWFGIAQTRRDNQSALGHAPVVQPSQQLKQPEKEAGRAERQDDYVSKVVGIATFVVLLVQSGIFARQASLMRRQADIYDRQAALMDGQIALSHQQLELSRQEAAYTRRPHFRVRFARVEQRQGFRIRESYPVTVKIDILNNGAADATVFRSHLEIFWTNTGLPGYFPYVNDEFGVHRFNDFVSGGQKTEYTVIAGRGPQQTEVVGFRIMGAEAEDVESGQNGWKMYLLGWIGYRRLDDSYSRFFDFAMEYQPDTGRFSPLVGDTDYSYDPDAK